MNLIWVVNGREEDGRYCCEVCWILLDVWGFEFSCGVILRWRARNFGCSGFCWACWF